ncbi:zinc-ribbon domain-containing protein [Arthrobacter caoxuetaonis]|uniref:Zinc-ribbon domain-containing protein n=1 Tax=Arthrobacter caoxuetaonis TaxID=2886935 RepID=A0A9X1MG20_9MICC|nr:zinc-ribbon domain-containing protein [Arthrobacter caoxuetaonis]MCC3299463.1 zinc-ribbon domain-containing protein [Arthrobacter caoxuetaonis]USQ59045.1 zinc-ribbon domain-containing protein [Arthrobacter caoxuetaonis]
MTTKTAPRRPSLQDANPELASEWHTELNGDLTPASVTPSSLKKAWWACPKGHLPFYSRIANRNAGSGCPVCGRERTTLASSVPAPGRSLAELHPEIAADWDIEANGDLTPSRVRRASNKVVSWICPNGHGSYRATTQHRVYQGQRCPVCSEQARADLRTLPAPGRSLAERNPALAAEWNTEANAPRTTADVALQSKRAYVWNCPEGHAPYRMRVADRHFSNGCPVCKPSSAARALPL